jgi:hypothetical protein
MHLNFRLIFYDEDCLDKCFEKIKSINEINFPIFDMN